VQWLKRAFLCFRSSFSDVYYTFVILCGVCGEPLVFCFYIYNYVVGRVGVV